VLEGSAYRRWAAKGDRTTSNWRRQCDFALEGLDGLWNEWGYKDLHECQKRKVDPLAIDKLTYDKRLIDLGKCERIVLVVTILTFLLGRIVLVVVMVVMMVSSLCLCAMIFVQRRMVVMGRKSMREYYRNGK
jgi:hypothetical protein